MAGPTEGALSLHAAPRQRAKRDNDRALQPPVPHRRPRWTFRRAICTSTVGRTIDPRPEENTSYEIESAPACHPGSSNRGRPRLPSEFSYNEAMIALVAKTGVGLDPAELQAFCMGVCGAQSHPAEALEQPTTPHVGMGTRLGWLQRQHDLGWPRGGLNPCNYYVS